jgi:hypothetical protein
MGRMNRIFFLDTFFIFGLTGSGLFGNAVKIIFLARWAAGRPAGSQRFLPFMATMITLKTARRTDNLVTATFDIDGFAVNQGIGHRAAGLLYNTPECCPGNTHVATGFLVGHPLQVR